MSPSDSLGETWPALAARLDRAGALHRWATREPVLAGFDTVSGLAAVVHRSGSAARADPVMGALVRLAAADGGDDTDAALLVAHLLANGTRVLAVQLRDLSGDIDQVVAGELWLQIRGFPWRRRTRAYAKSLLLDTRRAVLADLAPYRSAAGGTRVVLVDTTSLPPPARTGTPTAADGPALVSGAAFMRRWTLEAHDRDDITLGDLLDWAERTRVLAADEVALLTGLVAAGEHVAAARGAACRHGGLHCAAEIALAAAPLGVGNRTVWRRRDRVLSALAAARADYVAAVS